MVLIRLARAAGGGGGGGAVVPGEALFQLLGGTCCSRRRWWARSARLVGVLLRGAWDVGFALVDAGREARCSRSSVRIWLE